MPKGMRFEPFWVLLRTFVRKFSSRILLNFYCSQVMSYLSVRNTKKKKKTGVAYFVSIIKRVENCPDFEQLAHVIQYGPQGFIVKNTEG